MEKAQSASGEEGVVNREVAWITWFTLALPAVLWCPSGISTANAEELINRIILQADFCETWYSGTHSLLQEYASDYSTPEELLAKLMSLPELDSSCTTHHAITLSFENSSQNGEPLNALMLGYPELVLGSTTIRTTGKCVVLAIAPGTPLVDGTETRGTVLVQIAAVPRDATLISITSERRVELGNSAFLTIHSDMSESLSIRPQCRYYIDVREMHTIMGLEWERRMPSKPEVVLFPEGERFWVATSIGTNDMPKEELDGFKEAWRSVCTYVQSKVTKQSLGTLFSKKVDATLITAASQDWLIGVPMKFIRRGGRSATFSQLPSEGFPLPPTAGGSRRWLVVQAVYDRPTRAISTVYIGVVREQENPNKLK